MADKIHTIKKTLRLTPKEASLLAEKSAARKMNEAQYMRFLISQKPNDYPDIRQLLRELINEVNRIGINVNQIVFHHNSELYYKSDKQALTAYMRKLNDTLKEAVERIGNQ